MKQYLDIVRNVLEKGTEKLPERKLEGGRKLDNATIGLPNQVFSHEMTDGFPLLTTKKMGLKNIAVELEGFIKGITSKKWYQDRDCNIWNQWSNPIHVEQRVKDHINHGALPTEVSEIRKICQERCDDLGPIYGYQWRHFNEQYGPITGWLWNFLRRFSIVKDFTGYDQLKNVVDTLKSHPADRRMVCSAWNPNQIHMMALPPCHFAWVVTVYDYKLHLCWVQRSCDLALGVPYNIASYALLLKLLAKHAKLTAGNLMGILIDCHIYENQIDGMKEQLKREPRDLPEIIIPNHDLNENWDFWKWDHSQLKLANYNPHSAIKMGVTV